MFESGAAVLAAKVDRIGMKLGNALAYNDEIMIALTKLPIVAMLFLVHGPALVFAQWQPQTIDSKADFRGLCVVSAKVAWVSGTLGTYSRTTDAGKTWSVGTVEQVLSGRPVLAVALGDHCQFSPLPASIGT